MKVSLIYAADQNGLIGAGGGLPWHCPDDLRWFRRCTIGAPVIMGRKTYLGLPGRLCGRYEIVLSRRFAGPGHAESLPEAIAEAQRYCLRNQLRGTEPECFIIGGASVYRRALESGVVDRIYQTLIHGEHDGDTYMPPIGDDWMELLAEDGEGCRFRILERGDAPYR